MERVLAVFSFSGGLALSLYLYRRHSKKIQPYAPTGGLPDPDPLYDFKLVGLLSEYYGTAYLSYQSKGNRYYAEPSLC